jgi:hydrogenase nickel incorporation protein HypB
MERDILDANRRIAEENKSILERHEVKAYDILGAIGSGKTTLIEKMIDLLSERGMKAGAIAGDVAGEVDYKRFRRCGIQAENVNTGKECHLDAHLISHVLEKMNLEKIDILFIENVGNLVCPVDFPLGAEKRVVMISVTEGDDMIRKHPLIFVQTDFAVLNKIDLADIIEVDPDVILRDFERVNPHGKIFLTDAKHGIGVKGLLFALIENNI